MSHPPSPHYEDATIQLHHGDCLDVLQSLPDASVDAVVTDPPYGLEFMGKAWDSFGRDTGPGYAEKPRFTDRGDASPLARTSGPNHFRAGAPFQRWCVEWSRECLRILRPGGHMLAFGGTRTFHRLACAVEDAGFEVRDSLAWLYGSGFPKSLNLVDGDGERTGWGTALKPAFEPIVVARKPLAGTVAANVLAHGTGALNIDGCRVGYTSDADKASARPGGKATSLNGALAGKAQACEQNGSTEPSTPAETRDTSTLSSTASASNAPTTPPTSRTEFEVKQAAGRWPANVILDESQAAVLDAMSGELASGGGDRGTTSRDGLMGPDSDRGRTTRYERGADSGGASRFFYVAKADSSERVRLGGIAHPTVKPLDLMRWLVRLVTPPGGTVLEPFAGSGTTVEACILEGFRCVAIEREADYLPLIVQRINRRRDPVAAVRAQGEDGGLFDLLDGGAA